MRRFLSAPTASCLISGACCKASATSLRRRPTKKWFRQHSSVRLNSRLCSVVGPHRTCQCNMAKWIAITRAPLIKHITQTGSIHLHGISSKHRISKREGLLAACCGENGAMDGTICKTDATGNERLSVSWWCIYIQPGEAATNWGFEWSQSRRETFSGTEKSRKRVMSIVYKYSADEAWGKEGQSIPTKVRSVISPPYH